jgi:four helix bundle protein
MAGARKHRELDVWKLAFEARVRVRRICQRPGFRQHLWLRSQLWRASNSACTNTAEGFGRYYPKEFSRYLGIAKASLLEIEEHLSDVAELNLATAEELREIVRYARRAGGAANRLMAYLSTAKAPPFPLRRRRDTEKKDDGPPTPSGSDDDL